MSEFAQTSQASSLGQSFGIAGGVVLVGVLASWIFLKQGGSEINADLPQIPSFTLTTVQDVSEVNWIERAEQAFAAGRIARPANDSALFFYQKMLARDPQDPDALLGVDRVIGYLVNGAEGALREEEWHAASDIAQQVLDIDSGNLAARSVKSRVQRYEQIKALLDKAVEQIASGQLTQPADNNALASYREILSIDPNNAVALQGVESVAQRLATIAQTEAFAENHERARELIARAKSIAPNAPGIAETEKLTMQWSELVKDQAMKGDLLAAAKAIQEGNLVGDENASGLGALDHYRSALKKDPGSPAALSGVQLVINGLIDRAWSHANEERLAPTVRALQQAESAGAQPEQLADLQAEVLYLRRLESARAGEFDSIVPIRELQVRRQTAPVLDRAVEGYIELLFTVTETGSVRDIEVVEASDDDLNRPAIDAVERWRFEPYLFQGRPMPIRSGVRFSFQS